MNGISTKARRVKDGKKARAVSFLFAVLDASLAILDTSLAINYMPFIPERGVLAPSRDERLALRKFCSPKDMPFIPDMAKGAPFHFLL
jgi:hypothetical protein